MDGWMDDLMRVEDHKKACFNSKIKTLVRDLIVLVVVYTIAAWFPTPSHVLSFRIAT